MKKMFFGLFLLPALLVSCGTMKPEEGNNKNPDNNETTENGGTNGNSDNNESTDNGGDNGNSDNNESTDNDKRELRTWSESEVSLMKENLNNFTIPSFTACEGSWVFDDEYECLSFTAKGANSDVDKVYEELIASNLFESINEPAIVEADYAAEVAHYFPETEIISYVDIDIYTKDSSLCVDAYYFYYYKDWNEKAIKEVLTSLDLPDATIPKPNFEMTIFEIDETYILEGIFTLYCHTETDKSDDYKAQLDTLGYISKPTEYEGTSFDFKVDPVSKLALDVYFDSEYGDTVIDVYAGLFDDLNAK